MKNNILAFAVLALVASAPAVAQADTLVPARGRTVDLGGVNGVAYYTVEKSGFRVVATLAEPGNTPVRMEAVLAPGQSMLLSAPKGRGEEATQVEIARRNDELHVTTPALTQ